MFNCSHMFCEWCVNSWSILNRRCPICRVTVTNRVLCLPFDNHIKKLIERGPDRIKTLYEELTTSRYPKRPQGISINYIIINLYYLLFILIIVCRLTCI